MPDRSNPESDDAIIDRITSGDVNAFESLLERYQNYIFSLVRRHVPDQFTEDVAQDAFIRIYKALPDFSRKSSLKRWMTVITLNTCRDQLRKKYRSREIPMSALGDGDRASMDILLSVKAVDVENRPNLWETRSLLDRILSRLTPENRMVMDLVYFEGYSTKEAASLLGWTQANVKIRLFRGRKQLNTLLKKFMKE